jgi:hypothetical protein
MFCTETMLEFLEGSSQKIGGPNHTSASPQTGIVTHNTHYLCVRVFG